MRRTSDRWRRCCSGGRWGSRRRSACSRCRGFRQRRPITAPDCRLHWISGDRRRRPAIRRRGRDRRPGRRALAGSCRWAGRHAGHRRQSLRRSASAAVRYSVGGGVLHRWRIGRRDWPMSNFCGALVDSWAAGWVRPPDYWRDRVIESAGAATLWCGGRVDDGYLILEWHGGKK